MHLKVVQNIPYENVVYGAIFVPNKLTPVGFFEDFRLFLFCLMRLAAYSSSPTADLRSIVSCLALRLKTKEKKKSLALGVCKYIIVKN